MINEKFVRLRFLDVDGFGGFGFGGKGKVGGGNLCFGSIITKSRSRSNHIFNFFLLLGNKAISIIYAK